MGNNQSDRLNTVNESLERLHIGRTKFYELVADGKIQLVRFGKRCVRVRQSDLEALIANGIAS